MKTTTQSVKEQCAFVLRSLGAADRGSMAAHLLALEEADRCLRFGAAIDPDTIARYVQAIDFDRDCVFGVDGPDRDLIGLAHVALGADGAELGVSVAAAWRQRGVAGALAASALRAAESKGAKEFRFHFAATNEGMRRLARQLDMAVSTEGSDLIARRALVATEPAGEEAVLVA